MSFYSLDLLRAYWKFKLCNFLNFTNCKDYFTNFDSIYRNDWDIYTILISGYSIHFIKYWTNRIEMRKKISVLSEAMPFFSYCQSETDGIDSNLGIFQWSHRFQTWQDDSSNKWVQGRKRWYSINLTKKYVRPFFKMLIL